jgi:hypothetical protein
MGLEAGTTISALVSTNPVGATDPKSQGDDHIRLIKAVLKATFPNFTGVLTPSHTDINNVVTSHTFVSTDAGSATAPNVHLDRNSASPAVADFIGMLTFRGRDSLAAITDYARLVGQIADPVAATKTGNLLFQLSDAGTVVTRLTLNASGATLVGALTATNTILSGNIWGTVNTSGLELAGGNALNVGANLHLFGGAHASFPNEAFLDASRTRIRSQDGSVNYLDLGTTGLIIDTFIGSNDDQACFYAIAGTVFLRPNGRIDTTGQMTIASTGNVTVAGNVNATGSVTAASFSGSGASLTALSGTNITTGTVADARIASTLVRTSTTLTAGNGLTGGGTLAADRTFTLGTPSSIDNSTTNSVTATSHTHALGATFAEVYTGAVQDQTVFGVGHMILCNVSTGHVRNSAVSPRLSSDADDYTTGGALALLSGTWRSRGAASGIRMLQRTA